MTESQEKTLHQLSLRTWKLFNDKSIDPLSRSKGQEEIKKDAVAANVCMNKIFCYVSKNQDELSKELKLS